LRVVGRPVELDVTDLPRCERRRLGAADEVRELAGADAAERRGRAGAAGTAARHADDERRRVGDDERAAAVAAARRTRAGDAAEEDGVARVEPPRQAAG